MISGDTFPTPRTVLLMSVAAIDAVMYLHAHALMPVVIGSGVAMAMSESMDRWAAMRMGVVMVALGFRFRL